MFERRPSLNSQQNINMNSPRSKQILTTPTKSQSETAESLQNHYSPTISRYGRSHKPKMQDDYVSTDKKVSAYLKLSPGNQMKFFSLNKEYKKKTSPKKISPEGAVKRGRPPKTPPKDQQREVESLLSTVKVEPQDPSLPVNGCEWMVGDLAWARVGGHPFWPCIIALDPIQKIFTKIVLRGRNNSVGQRWMHVQFFGDNGRRSWLNTSAIMTFNGRDAFIQLGETILAGMRKKDPKQTSAFVIKPAVVQVWEKAVQEAEDLINATREERIAFFATHFPVVIPKIITRAELIEKALDNSQSPPKKRGRKRKAESSPLEEEIKNKQIKLEEVKVKQEPEDIKRTEVKMKEEIKEIAVTKEEKPENSLLSSTPRTIADRKKRQALLMQMARSNQQAAADAAPVPSADKTQAESPASTTPDKPTTSKRSSFPESTPMEKKKPKKKYMKKNLDADFQNFSSRNFEKISDEHPELNEKEINKHLQNLWNHMDETAKTRYRARRGCATGQEQEEESLEESLEELEEENEVEVQSSKSSIEVDRQSSKSSSPAPSVAATQKATATKRICKTLFSGIKAEKVCQICEKTGDTVRCRGPCQGFYHPDCVTNPPPMNLISTPFSTPDRKGGKKGRPKKSLDASPQSSPKVENGTPTQEGENQNILKDIKTPVMNMEKEDIKTGGESAAVEVVEPEVKGLGKVRKGSKDSKESLSSEEDEGFRCKDCQEGRSQPCFACHEYVRKKSGEAKLYRCITAKCGKVYHEECLKAWPQTSWRSNGGGKGTDRGVLTCPQHTCHTCVSDNPAVIKARYSNDKLVRCIRCPTSYHYGNYCLPAGSEILTNSQIICPQHYQPPRKGIIHHVNAAWCFICASGGSLICCDLCPTAFHADCLNISTPSDGYVCEDCQTGRFPLYGEIVWVKLGCYRWWPAEILYPSQIPDNILNLPHVRGEFAVRFFGSHDHYWVNRGRVFLYQDGDTAGKGNYKKSSVDQMFERAVKEASVAQRKYLEEKATRDAETRPGMKPPNYVKLKANKPVGNVRTMEMNVSNLTPCECDPKSDNPCALDSDCLNRILMVECNPLVCPAGEKCRNQLFEKRQYPPLQPYQTQERGWGLKTLVPLKKGDFVIEYVGEMIDEEEYKRRLAEMHERNEDNFYFLTIDKDRMLDAGPKGNVARFMNHSCQPNCETQKWTVNGDTRVGLFALCDIPADTELVFNYNLESTGNDKKPCMCGAPNCSGFIGVKAIKQEKEESKDKKPVKKKKTASKPREGKCFMCGKDGELLWCDGKHCTKVYHLSCLGKKQLPQGYWLCPWHQCNVCNKGRVRRCTLCVNSYCQEHSEGNIREDPDSKHLLCTKHNLDKVDDNTGLPQSKDESLLMEVDGDTSDNSTTASSLNSDNPSTKESINNNVFKTAETPRLRTRRSKSFTGDKPGSDILINGSMEKVNRRRKRPSSVDEGLIVSCDKTEHKDKRNHTVDRDNAITSNGVVKEILDEVINNLDFKEEKLSGTSDGVAEINKETMNKILLNGEVVQKTVLGVKEDDELSQQNLEIYKPNTDDTESSESEKLHNSISEENVISENKDGSNIPSENNDIANTNLHDNSATLATCAKDDNESAVQNKKPKTESEIFERNDKSQLVQENTVPDKYTETEAYLDNNDGIACSEKKSDKSIFLGERNDDELYCKTDTKENLTQNGLIVDEKEESDHTITNYLDETYTDDPKKDKKSEDMLNLTNILDIDEHVDDFELSYSECSNDKLYKSVNNSESSIDMKLTNGGNSEDEVTRKLEEINSPKELSNGIEQSSIMEVV